MKKIISIILSITILYTCIGPNIYAADTSASLISSNNYEYIYRDTEFLNKIGLNFLAKPIDKFVNNISSNNLLKNFALLVLMTNVWNFFTGIGNISESIYKSYYYTSYFLSDIYNSFKNNIIPESNNEPENVLETLTSNLNDLKGQEKAKEEITKIIVGITANKYISKLSNTKYNHGDVIYMYGPSRVGKSFAASKIAASLSSAEPYIISSSDVNTNKNNKGPSAFEQIFRTSNPESGQYGLIKYIQSNKNGVVIINEYDKMFDKSLDEGLRKIIDDGIINISGKPVDCSGITFIITSNESSHTIKLGNQDKNDTTNIDDGTGSRTSIFHDKSFINRVNLVEFENLEPKDYKQIIIDTYNSQYKDFFYNSYKINLDIDNSINNIVKKAVKENNGTKSIKDIFDNLLSKIISLKIQLKKENANDDVKDYLLLYDEINNEITLKEKDKSNQKISDCSCLV